jgi:hypothetical protein
MSHAAFLDHKDHWDCAIVSIEESLLLVSCSLVLQVLVGMLVEDKVLGIVLRKAMVLVGLSLPNLAVEVVSSPQEEEGSVRMLKEDMRDMLVDDHSQEYVVVNVRLRRLPEGSVQHRHCSSASC